MGTIEVIAQGTVEAPAEVVYGYVAGLRDHRPHYLPPAFSDYTVDRGEVGAGSVIRFRITAGNRTRTYEMTVTEPEPGRVLTETDARSSLVTTYEVVPDKAACRVTIKTTWQGASGVGGFFERTFAPKALTRIYKQELDLLDAYARRGVRSS